MPTKEELLRAGGKVQEAPGHFESFRRGVAQTLSFGHGDEMAGASAALGTAIGRSLRRFRDGKLVPESIEAELEALGSSYRKGRDEVRADNHAASEANPGTYTVGRVAGALPLARVVGPVAGASLRGTLAVGAAEGAAEGLGSSEAELLDGEVGGAALDTVKGAGTGGVFAGGAHALGQGLRYVGRRVQGSLDDARGQLTDEARAAHEAEEAAAQQSALDAEVAMGKRQGQALQMNQRLDLQRAKEAERAARPQRGAQPQAPAMDEPDTAVLQGYRGKAGERRAANYRNVRDYERDLAGDPDMNTQAASRLQDYIDEYGDAVYNPGSFERRMVERYIRENWPPEVAERVLRERVGPAAEILPRPVSAGAAPAPAPQGPHVAPFAPLPARRPGNQMIDVGGQRGPEFSRQLTAGGGGAQDSVARAAEEAMAARRAGAAGAGLQSGRPMPAPTPAPAATAPLVAPPTRLSSPPDMDPTAVGRPPTQMFRDVAAQRESAAFGRMARSGGDALIAGNGILGAVARVSREALQDPAVRAKAISSLRVANLAKVDPVAFGRVGRVLTRAMEQGPDKHRVARHVLLQKDAAFREADRKAGEGLENITDDELLRLLQSAR